MFSGMSMQVLLALAKFVYNTGFQCLKSNTQFEIVYKFFFRLDMLTSDIVEKCIIM